MREFHNVKDRVNLIESAWKLRRHAIDLKCGGIRQIANAFIIFVVGLAICPSVGFLSFAVGLGLSMSFGIIAGFKGIKGWRAVKDARIAERAAESVSHMALAKNSTQVEHHSQQAMAALCELWPEQADYAKEVV